MNLRSVYAWLNSRGEISVCSNPDAEIQDAELASFRIEDIPDLIEDIEDALKDGGKS